MVKKKEEKIKKEGLSGWQIILIIFGIIGVIVLVGGFVITGNVTNNFSSNCYDKEVPYEEQEEYLKTEYYDETVPYTEEVCESKYLQYNKEKGSCTNRVDNFFANDEPAKYSCTIINLDEEGGNFGMRMGFILPDGSTLEETQTKYIYSQGSEIFVVERDVSIQNCFCVEDIPTKQVCRDVIKYKDVQKSREVTAYKPVTKYKTEEVCE